MIERLLNQPGSGCCNSFKNSSKCINLAILLQSFEKPGFDVQYGLNFPDSIDFRQNGRILAQLA